MTVGELWKGSLLHEYAMYAGHGSDMLGAQYFVWGLLFLIFFCFLFRSQTGLFFSWAGTFLLSPVKRTYFDTSASVRYGLPLSLLILTPVAAYLVYGTSAADAPYLLILGCIAGYLAFRYIIFRGISYVSGNSEPVTVLSRMTFLFFTLSTAIFCILLAVGMFLPDIYPFLMCKAAPAVSAVLVLLYFVELIRIFFAFKEPLLLSILYLCTLEMLPIAIAVVTILKY